MLVLSNADLESSLILALNSVPHYYPYLSSILHVLYHTGCRPAECLDIRLWSRIDSQFFLLKSLKGNNFRHIRALDLPLDYATHIDSGFFPYSPVNYRQFSYQFSQIYQYNTAIIDGKGVGLYLYRHAYIKRLSDAGLSIEQIRQLTGHRSDSVVEGYINSLIYY